MATPSNNPNLPSLPFGTMGPITMELALADTALSELVMVQSLLRSATSVAYPEVLLHPRLVFILEKLAVLDAVTSLPNDVFIPAKKFSEFSLYVHNRDQHSDPVTEVALELTGPAMQGLFDAESTVVKYAVLLIGLETLLRFPSAVEIIARVTTGHKCVLIGCRLEGGEVVEFEASHIMHKVTEAATVALELTVHHFTLDDYNRFGFTFEQHSYIYDVYTTLGYRNTFNSASE